MKRLWICAVLLALLAGCGDGAAAPEPAPSAEPVPSAAVTVAPTASVPEDSPSPEPAPSPTRVVETDTALSAAPAHRYGSLTELCPAGPYTLVDGLEVRTLWIDNKIFLSQADMAAAHPELALRQALGRARFGWRDAELDMGLRVVEADGTGLSGEVGEGCVAFDGEQVEYWLALWCFEGEFRWLWEEDTLYLTTAVFTDAIPRGREVPVLMYHAVSDSLWGIASLFVSPADLRAQIEYLLKEGYEPIFFSDLPNLDRYEKPVILTFDDGYDDNYYNLLPVLREYNVKATCFVITGMLGDEYYMTEEQVRELSDSGLVDVQSHTVTHDDLNALSYDRQEYQMAQSQKDIARITGKIPYVISYPSGNRNGNTLALAPEYYDFGIDMNGGMWTTGDDFYTVDRIYISRFDTLGEFAAKLG